MKAKPRSRSGSADIRYLGIYGQGNGAAALDLHIEELQARAAALDYLVKPHVHPNMLQIFLSLSGKCTATIDDDTHHVTGPCVISIPGGIAHCFHFGPGVKGWILTVSHQRVVEAPLNRNEDNVAALLRQAHVLEAREDTEHIRTMATLLQLFHDEFYAEHSGKRAGLEYLLRLILLHHWRAVEQSRPLISHADRDRKLFYDFRALVEQQYLKHWSITKYTHALKCSQSRLNQVCKVFSNGSANAVVLHRLSEEAKRLLTFTTAPAANIGYRLGFQEPSYFTRFFKKQTQQTPGQFREKRASANRKI